MTLSLSTRRDPVCGMDIEVARSAHSTTYRGLIFHFCSAQCLERFTETPTLYTNGQRTADIKPMPKKHTLRIAAGTATDVNLACQQIRQMMGIASVSATSATDDALIVEYDLRQVSLSQIEAAATAQGLRFKGGLHGFRRGFWKFTEANEAQNAAHLGSAACCSRPPSKIR